MNTIIGYSLGYTVTHAFSRVVYGNNMYNVHGLAIYTLDHVLAKIGNV